VRVVHGYAEAKQELARLLRQRREARTEVVIS